MTTIPYIVMESRGELGIRQRPAPVMRGVVWRLPCNWLLAAYFWGLYVLLESLSSILTADSKDV